MLLDNKAFGIENATALEKGIASATEAMMGLQRADGHWVFELEADSTIPAEYVLLKHYLDEPIEAALEQKFAVYLRRQQGAHGGWPLFHDGDFDMSASVKVYFALKMIGDSPDATHMVRAREAILSRGGAKQSNVFTRILLALYGVMKWTSIPVMPVEIMLLPRWFPFHLSKISYWGRTVIVPLLVLQALKPLARNRRGVTIDELFLENPRDIGPPERAPHQNAGWFALFRIIDLEPGEHVPLWHRTASVDFNYIASGECTVQLGDDGAVTEEVQLTTGDTFVHRGPKHAWINTGTDVCRIVCSSVAATLPNEIDPA